MHVQVLSQRLPVILRPSQSKVFACAIWEASMLKDNLGAGSLLNEFEFDDRKVSRLPGLRSPGLNYSLVRYEFDLPARYVPAED